MAVYGATSPFALSDCLQAKPQFVAWNAENGVTPDNKPDRADISPGEIETTIKTPDHRVVQLDGRVRYWRWVAARGRWLRVITEADGETVHNAFWDRGFRP